jgi:hypothetical protein
MIKTIIIANHLGTPNLVTFLIDISNGFRDNEETMKITMKTMNKIIIVAI